MKEFDTLVFIGRFQPFHNGHKAVVDEALKRAKQVIILVGSSYAPRNIRNPFTFEEREEMIQRNYPENENLKIEPLSDYPYDDQRWAARVQKLVEYHTQPGDKIGLIGHTKDHTSYYLKMFPEWKDSVEVFNVDGINATSIREKILDASWPISWLESQMPLPSIYVMNDILWDISEEVPTEAGTQLFTEYRLIKKYKEAWAAAPYPPTFVTVDAVVVQSAHVLLIKRKSAPGIGQWALPGGFLNQTETRVDGMLRELKEETKIKVPEKVLKGSIKNQRTFDDPNRSTRGRTITTAFYIELENDFKLPKVTGADDAEKAKWIPLSQIKQEDMFEDHYHIIDYFVKLEEV